MPEAMRLGAAIDLYLDVQKAQGASKSTLAGKKSKLLRFLATTGNILPKNLSPRHVDAFFVEHADWQASTRKTTVQVLSAFQRFLHARKMLDRGVDILEGRRSIRIPRKPRVIIPARTFEPLLDSLKQGRDRITIAMGLYTLMRVSELTLVQWKHVDLEEGHIDIYRTKTQQADRIPISAELDNELRVWRRDVCDAMYGFEAANAEPQGDWYVICALKPVFDGKGFKPTEFSTLSPDTPLKQPGTRIKKLLDDFGISGTGVNMHTLRRSGATALEANLRQLSIEQPELGIDSIGIVQEMLGHANRVTTEIYLDRMPNRLRRDQLIRGQVRFYSG